MPGDSETDRLRRRELIVGRQWTQEQDRSDWYHDYAHMLAKQLDDLHRAYQSLLNARL